MAERVVFLVKGEDIRPSGKDPQTGGEQDGVEPVKVDPLTFARLGAASPPRDDGAHLG